MPSVRQPLFVTFRRVATEYRAERPSPPRRSGRGTPGLGQLAVRSISSDDFPMVMGVTVIGSMFLLTANIVVDVAYAFLDPRVRY